MAFIDDLLVVSIVGFLILIIWAKTMKKDIIDVLRDMKDFIKGE
jgi:hypothetical protein